LVEQLICNQQVAGSSPVASSTTAKGKKQKAKGKREPAFAFRLLTFAFENGELAERSKAADCKSAGLRPTEVRILHSPPFLKGKRQKAKGKRNFALTFAF
jgi:hypothetical protein